MSSLPEWKQLLLERKRREEEAREQREKQEEKKLASMPAWKRGIIQRRKAKQDCPGEPYPSEVRSPSDGLSDTDSSVTVNLGSDVSTSPDVGMWLDGDPKYGNQVSQETIVPVNENPFIKTQKRKGREVELCSPKSSDGDAGRGSNFEIKMEKFKDLSEGREKDQSSKQIEASWSRSVPKERDRNQKRQDKEFLKVKKEEEYRDTDSVSPAFSPTVPCLRTIRADNIIIIEHERNSNEERRGRWKDLERGEEDIPSKRGIKMDLKELLAGGGSVTEIRASEVLIIKPPEVKNKEEVEKNDGKREQRESRELRADMSWLKEKAKESVKEKERPWGQATVIKEDKKDNSDDCAFVERGGRVSQLLCKFGEHRKPPCRSKSSENLNPPQYLQVDDEDEREDRRSGQLKGVPKRSFSFSDRVFSTRENGFEKEVKIRDSSHSEKAYWTEVASLGRDNTTKIKMGCARLLEKDRLGRHRHWQSKEKPNRNIVDGEECFTIASIKNVDGISFAKRVAIRQEGRAREKNYGVEKEAKVEGQNSESKIQANLKDASHRYQSAFRESSSLLCTVQVNSNRQGLASSGLATSLYAQNEEKIVDSKVLCIDKGVKASKIMFELTKNSEVTLPSSGSGKDAKTLEAQPAPLEIQIPRTVFYVAEDMVERKKKSTVQDCDNGREVNSLKVDKPVESFNEKTEQQQTENTKENNSKDIDNSEVAVKCETVATATMAEAEIEQEVASQIGQSVETEKEVASSASEHSNDVVQEVSVSPQLPDSQSEVEEGEEVDCGGGINTESREAESDSEEENVQNDQVTETEILEDDKQFSEEDLQELTVNFESEESISPSSPESNLLEDMSRIYNLETVGSRSGLCLRDRAAEMPSVHLIKIKPLSSPKQGEGIQSIQRQIENFKLKEQEVLKSQICTSQKAKVQHSPKRNALKEEGTTQKQDEIINPQVSQRRVKSPEDPTIEINTSVLRSQSPANALKILDLAPTPVSSPSSLSPAQSPNNSPAQSPTPTLFTIKSASGGQVKRGTTITITPKKTQVQGSSPTATQTTSPTSNANTTTTTVNEPAKKKYPTVEEIEVIGGYLNLDKSCLVKNKGTSKKVKVCFSEESLEQLCEYPSETSMWAGSPYPLDQDEEVQMETVSIPKTTRSVGTATGRGLRVGQSHPLLKKHTV